MPRRGQKGLLLNKEKEKMAKILLVREFYKGDLSSSYSGGEKHVEKYKYLEEYIFVSSCPQCICYKK